jgi:hypothetical protein
LNTSSLEPLAAYLSHLSLTSIPAQFSSDCRYFPIYLENTKTQTNNLLVTPVTEEIKSIFSQPIPQLYDLLAKPNENNKSELMINMNLI